MRCDMGMEDMGIETDHHLAARVSALAQDLRALLGKLKRRLREQAHVGDLTPSQISVLLRLEKDGPATASGLARAEGMRPQSMAPVIAALEDAGLVSRGPDPADGRQTLLSLTDACRIWAEEARAARQDWLTRALQARLSVQEQGELSKAVELLKRLVDG
jgi:DNA-binding MarR family transcriptional regulator